jgi:coenzyme F420-0:L-glutamate ligase / coenzyme F420-1:gamma-L-glutamate ligase
MRPAELRIVGIPGLPEVVAGDHLGSLISQATQRAAIKVQEKDVLVVAQKIVSKAEGRVVRLDTVQPSSLARYWAEPKARRHVLLKLS